MKKIAVFFMFVVLMIVSVTGVSALYSPVTVAKIETPPTLDGIIEEGEWGTPVYSSASFSEILSHTTNIFLENDWPEYFDFYKDAMNDTSLMPSKIDIYMNWDDECFYLAVKETVEDRSAPNYKNIGNEDCIYFNVTEDPYNTPTSFKDYFCLMFTIHDDGDFISEYVAYPGYDVNPITTADDWTGIRDDAAKTTTYELRFYWDEILETAVNKQMTAGDMFGIPFAICPKNFDGDPNGIACIVPAGTGADIDKYNWAVTLGDYEGTAAIPAETEVPSETPAETPAEAPAEAAQPSAWAVEEVNAAIAAGLVPEELRNNYQNGISREDLSKMLGVLIDKVYAGEATSADAAFTDTTDAAVLKAANLGIINGYKQDDGTFMFKPANTLKRSEMSAIINRVAKLCGEETTGFDAEVKFEDTASHWCNGELGYPVHMGIVKGTSDTTFSPENTLTVEQTIMMIYRTYTALNK